MLKFKEFLNEARLAADERGYPEMEILAKNFNVAKPDFMEQVNAKLDIVTARRFTTPYLGLVAIARVLAGFNIILPRMNFLHPTSGEETVRVTHHGAVGYTKNLKSIDMTDQTPPLFVHFAYLLDREGYTKIYAELVDVAGLAEINNMDSEGGYVEIAENMETFNRKEGESEAHRAMRLTAHYNRAAKKRKGLSRFFNKDQARMHYRDYKDSKKKTKVNESESYVIKHKKTRQILHSVDDYATAKDLHTGLGKDKKNYGIYKTRSGGALANRSGTSGGWKMNEAEMPHSYVIKHKDTGKVVDTARDRKSAWETQAKHGDSYTVSKKVHRKTKDWNMKEENLQELTGKGKLPDIMNYHRREAKFKREISNIDPGRNKEKRIRQKNMQQDSMMHGAKAARARKLMKKAGVREAIISELSKKTMQSYRDKTENDVAHHEINRDSLKFGKTLTSPGKRAAGIKYHDRKRSNRLMGRYRAMVKMTEEKLDELSKDTLTRYATAAYRDKGQASYDMGGHDERTNFKSGPDKDNTKRIEKRDRGFKRAMRKLAK